MKIEIAASAGFCFGVRRATKTLEDEIASGSRTVYTLGRLIHNDGYNRSLRSAVSGAFPPTGSAM